MEGDEGNSTAADETREHLEEDSSSDIIPEGAKTKRKPVDDWESIKAKVSEPTTVFCFQMSISLLFCRMEQLIIFFFSIIHTQDQIKKKNDELFRLQQILIARLNDADVEDNIQPSISAKSMGPNL